MTRWHRAGVVSDNPRPSRPRRLQGSHRDAPRTISVRILVPTPVSLPLRGSLPALDPAFQRSLGFPPFRLAAFLRASLAPTFRCSLEVRWARVSELRTGCASRHARSMDIREIQTFSPSFCMSSPSGRSTIPSSSPCVVCGPGRRPTPEPSGHDSGGPYAPSHAAEPGVRTGAGLAGGEGPDHVPAVPAHPQRPAGRLQPDLEPGAGRQLRRDDGALGPRRTQGPASGPLRAALARPLRHPLPAGAR